MVMDIDESFSSSTNKVPNPFVLSFQQHEKDEKRKKNEREIRDRRTVPSSVLKRIKSLLGFDF